MREHGLKGAVYFVGVHEQRLCRKRPRESAGTAAYFDHVAALRTGDIHYSAEQTFIGKKVLTVLFFEVERRAGENGFDIVFHNITAGAAHLRRVCAHTYSVNSAQADFALQMMRDRGALPAVSFIF